MKGMHSTIQVFHCIPFFAGAFSNACQSMYSFKVCQTDFAGARMNAHSFRFLVVHSGMHAVVKQALTKSKPIELKFSLIDHTFFFTRLPFITDAEDVQRTQTTVFPPSQVIRFLTTILKALCLTSITD